MSPASTPVNRPWLRTDVPAVVALALLSVIGGLSFLWPFALGPDAALADASLAPWIFAAILPLILVLVAAQLSRDGVDSRSVAMLGVLAAVGAALRPLGAGIGGLEPLWIVLIIGGRVLGPAFGFALGSLTMFASALLTGGVGPWLPFQMVAAGWLAMGAGMLPPLRGRREVLMLAGYGVVAAIAFGFCMNLWFWPWAQSVSPQVAFEPGAAVAVNLHHWIAFNLTTSLGWDLTRAAVTAVGVLLLGGAALAALRRVIRTAQFVPAGVPAPVERSSRPPEPASHPEPIGIALEPRP